jgi:hypothetical protein
MEQSAATRSDSARTGTTREEWRNTLLAGLANYIDAGSIVAGAAGLTLWTKEFGLSSSEPRFTREGAPASTASRERVASG